MKAEWIDKVVNIIIPVFNSEPYLELCLTSVFKQTYPNLKVICIDDGSIDNSVSIIKSFQHNHSNLKLICKDNEGVSKARNKGLDLLDYNKNELLLFIDSDDWIESRYVETLVDMLNKYDTDLVCSSFFLSTKNSNRKYKQIESDQLMNSVEATSLLLRDETIQSHSVSKLFKIGLWENVRYNPELFYMEDQEVMYKIFYNSKNVFVTNYAGYHYRQDNEDAITKKRVTTKKVVSGLMGYYLPCLFNFRSCDQSILVKSAQYGLAGAYLMLLPYYSRKKADKKDKNRIKQIKIYIRENKVIKEYSPMGKKAAMKRKMYLFFPFLYPFLYRIGKKLL